MSGAVGVLHGVVLVLHVGQLGGEVHVGTGHGAAAINAEAQEADDLHVGQVDGRHGDGLLAAAHGDAARHVLEAHAATQVQTVDDDVLLILIGAVAADTAGQGGVQLVVDAQLAGMLVAHEGDILLGEVVQLDTEVAALTQKIHDLVQIVLQIVLAEQLTNLLGIVVYHIVSQDALSKEILVVTGEVQIRLPLLAGFQLVDAGLKVVLDLHRGQALSLHGDSQTTLHNSSLLSQKYASHMCIV